MARIWIFYSVMNILFVSFCIVTMRFKSKRRYPLCRIGLQIQIERKIYGSTFQKRGIMEIHFTTFNRRENTRRKFQFSRELFVLFCPFFLFTNFLISLPEKFTILWYYFFQCYELYISKVLTPKFVVILDVRLTLRFFRPSIFTRVSLGPPRKCQSFDLYVCAIFPFDLRSISYNGKFLFTMHTHIHTRVYIYYKGRVFCWGKNVEHARKIS